MCPGTMDCDTAQRTHGHRLFLTLVTFLIVFGAGDIAAPELRARWCRGHPGGRGTPSSTTAGSLKGTCAREFRRTAGSSARIPGGATKRHPVQPHSRSGSSRTRAAPSATARRATRAAPHRDLRRRAARRLPRRSAGSPPGPYRGPFTDSVRAAMSPAQPFRPSAHPTREIQPVSPSHSVHKSASTLPHHPSLHGQTVATAQSTFPISLIPH